MSPLSTLREVLMPRRLLTLALLVGAWCVLWGTVSFANVLSGTLVAVVVTLVAGIQPGHGRIRAVPLMRFAVLVAADLVVSTVSVAKEILTRTDHTDEVIIAVDTQAGTRSHILLLVVAITVTPGTAVIDTDADTGRLYLHVLHADRAAATTAQVQRLAELACQALPVAAESNTDANRVASGEVS